VISGSVVVKGTYQRLDFDNQPVRRTEPIELEISAVCNATDPSKIVWGTM